MIRHNTCSVEVAFRDQKYTNRKSELRREMAFRSEGSPLEGNRCAEGNTYEGLLSRKADNTRIPECTRGKIGFSLLMDLLSNAGASNHP
jgi:hypothetical protein